MTLTNNEVQTLVDRLRSLNIVAWEMVSFVPPKTNSTLLTILETVINETDALVDRYDRSAAVE